MKKQLLLAILPLLLCCCKKSSDLPRLINNANTGIEVNTKVMLESKPTLLAFNFTEDTVVSYRWPFNGKDIVELKTEQKNIQSDLKVIIDTSYSFYAKNFEYKNINVRKILDSVYKLNKRDINYVTELVEKKSHQLKNKYVSAYPVLIYNNSNSKAYIYKYSSEDLMMIQEALDADGIWKPIEYRFFSLGSCLIGSPHYPYFVLSPKHYMATSIIKYKGDFKTKIRVKVILDKKICYSNAVDGSVNRSQFNQDFIKLYMQEWERSDEKIFQETKDIMFLDFLK